VGTIGARRAAKTKMGSTGAAQANWRGLAVSFRQAAPPAACGVGIVHERNGTDPVPKRAPAVATGRAVFTENKEAAEVMRSIETRVFGGGTERAQLPPQSERRHRVSF